MWCVWKTQKLCKQNRRNTWRKKHTQSCTGPLPQGTLFLLLLFSYNSIQCDLRGTYIKLMHAIWTNIWRFFCWTHTQLYNGPLSQKTVLLIFPLESSSFYSSPKVSSFFSYLPPSTHLLNVLPLSPPNPLFLLFSVQPPPPAPQTRLTLSYFPPRPTSPTNLLSGESPDGGQGNGGLMKAGERGGKHKHKKGLLVQLGRAPGIHLLYLFSHSI